MRCELYKVDVYDPVRDVGQDQYMFHFHFALNRWSSDQARRISWFIASKLFEADESVAPGSTKGMRVYLNSITETADALPKRAFFVCDGITVWIGLSPVFSQLRNELKTRIRLTMIGNEILSQSKTLG